MREVAVIGVGIQKWGELWEKSLRNIYVESALNAIKDAGVDKIDSMYVGCMSSGLFTGQEHIAPLLAEYVGLNPIPSVRVESACASGGVAFRQGFIEVASGMSDVVLVGGVEKMTDVDGAAATYALGTAADQDYECYSGATFPGLYALIARAHMDKYGTTLEQMADITVKNHENGSHNSNAQYQFTVTREQVMTSTMVADPLRVLHCSGITDGAAAAILVPLDMAKSLKKDPIIKVAGSGHATDTIALHSRDDITFLGATAEAANKAYQMAGIGPKDIDLAEVHDCFSIAEICVTEALGFFEKGHGGKAAEAGKTRIDGEIPVNPSGGLKAKGHPVGATGVAQIHELVGQLRQEEGVRQVKNARRALSQNMGGTGASALVHILEVV
jgi:acetyl-CoA C-acetyltransferase